jgi:hypothetical protein
MIQNKQQFRERLRNEILLCKRCGIVYLAEYAALRKNLSEEALDAEVERQVNLEKEAESKVEWEPAFYN